MNKKIFFLLLIFHQLSFASEQYFCINTENNQSFLSSMVQTGVYSDKSQLIRVIQEGNLNISLSEFPSQKEICFRKELDQSIILLKSISNKESLISQARNEKYNLSLLLLVYILVIGFLAFLRKIDVKTLLNPFKPYNVSLGSSFALLLVICVASTYLISKKLTDETLFLFLFIFLTKLLSAYLYSLIFKIDNNFSSTITSLFKILNILFILIIGLQITLLLNFNPKSVLNMYILLLLVAFVISTLVSFVKSERKIRWNHIIYYLCALEILPVLFLKEYFIN